jgi:ribonuclease HI
MSMDDFDLDNLINESYKQSENEETKSEENVINYELMVFTDGGHERVKQRSSFGIYIKCQNKESELYTHNETKIIKKLNKDSIIYNHNNNNIYYHTLFKNDTSDKCIYTNCKYFPIYANNELENGLYCKSHKNENMKQTMTFVNYDPTNIRAEGLAICYGLLYLKSLLINNVNKTELVDYLNTYQVSNNNLEFKEYIIPFKTNNYKFYQIITDSEFWINVITKWGNNWIKQNKVLEKKNIDIIYFINGLLNELLDNKTIIHFKFVRGHSDKNNKEKKYNIYQKGNVIADKLANIAKENVNYNIKISFE